jgi:beta-ureidopropionase / N-carbamoyl-L-amino-acid hydrolase
MIPKKSDPGLEQVRQFMQTALDEKAFEQLLDNPGSIGLDKTCGITRLAFSEEDLKARNSVITHMKNILGLAVRIDAWGNIIGRRPGSGDNRSPLMTGSHLDTVRHGGKFDGAAGVFCGLEMIRILNLLDIQTRHPIEVVVFAAEEANQSGISTIGSRGVTGRLTRQALETCCDDQGIPILQSIEKAGGNPSLMDQSVYGPGAVRAFIEIHNEQMPRLEDTGNQLGIVTGVTGIRRRRFTLEGTAGHGGTIPMNRRQDALVAAADMIGAVRRAALANEDDSVATVGHISVSPNSVNVVPGRVVLELEIRSYEPGGIDRIDEAVQQAAREFETTYGVSVHRSSPSYDNAPRQFSHRIRGALTRASEQCGLRTMDLVSMAGHDAYHMSYVTDSGMLFIPSRNGKSHCPEEFSDPVSLVHATQVLLTALLLLDKEE